MAGKPVAVEGLKEFRARLRALEDAAIDEEWKNANFRVAQIAVDAGRRNASTKLERRAAQTLKATRSGTNAAVSLGQGFPAAAGAEYGAYRNRERIVGNREIRKRRYKTSRNAEGNRIRTRLEDNVRTTRQRTVIGWRQFKDWRGHREETGYFLWPGIREERERIIEAYGEAIDHIAVKAFPE